MKARTHDARHKELFRIGTKCKAWRNANGLRLVDIANFGLSVQSISNFEYGLNDSALALLCYVQRGYKGEF